MFCVSVACRQGEELLVAVIADPEGRNLFSAVRGGGAIWNGRPMGVSGPGGARAARLLATGYPWRALPALELYLGIFRDVFAQSKAIRRCGSAALDLAYTAAGRLRRLLRVPPVALGHRRRHAAGARGGGIVTDVDGGEGFFAGGNIVAGRARPSTASCSPPSGATPARRRSSGWTRSRRPPAP